VSVNNTTNSILSGRHISTFIGSSSGLLRNRSKNYLYFSALWDPKCLQIILQKCKVYEYIYFTFLREWFEGHKNALVKCIFTFSWSGGTRAFRCPQQR